jgi:hypothetical protein
MQKEHKEKEGKCKKCGGSGVIETIVGGFWATDKCHICKGTGFKLPPHIKDGLELMKKQPEPKEDKKKDNEQDRKLKKKIREWKKDWGKRNPEKVKLYHKKYREKNREKRRIYNRMHSKTNREYYNEWKRQWKLNNPNLYLKMTSDVLNKVHGFLRDKVLKRDNYTCRFCGLTNEEHIKKWGSRINVHHKDGEGTCSDNPNNIMRNMITVCKSCHTKDEWRRRKEFKQDRE